MQFFKRVVRALGRAFLVLTRYAFIVLLLVIPVPVGELFHRLLDRRRRTEVTQTVKDTK